MTTLALVESNTSGTGRLFAQAARQRGLQPVLLAADPARYGFAAADGLEIVSVDTHDEGAVLAACQGLAAGLGLGGVTSSSEYFVEAAAVVAGRLGLAGPRPDGIRACRNKHAQRVRLQAAGVGIPAFRLAMSVDEAVAAAGALGLPVVVKPVNGSGSVGVRLCARVEAVARHAKSLLERTHNERGLPCARQVLVEELVAGPEYSVETFGQTVVGVTAKHLGAPPYFVEVGHDHPAVLSDAASAAIGRAVVRALRALDLGWGPAHAELRLTDRGPAIIEVNPRLGGDYIPELVRLARGVDLIGATIDLAVGRRPVLEQTAAQHASVRFMVPPRAGVLAGIDGLEDAGRLPGVVDVQLYRRAGDRLRPCGDFRDRAGHAVAVGDTAAAAGARAAAARDAVRLAVAPAGHRAGPNDAAAQSADPGHVGARPAVGPATGRPRKGVSRPCPGL
jgi:biotin carboxylase